MLHTKDSQLLKELIKWFPEKQYEIKKCFKKYQEDYNSSETEIATQRATPQIFGAQYQQQNDKIYIQQTSNGIREFVDKKTNVGAMAVPGTYQDMEVQKQGSFYPAKQSQGNENSSQIILLNSVNQIENLPQYQVFLDRLQEDVLQDKQRFMQFMASYVDKSSSFLSCASQLSKIDAKMNMKDQQLEKKLGDQCIDTSKLEIFNSKHKTREDTYEQTEKQDKQYRYKGQAFIQPSKTFDPYANHSHLRDINGDDYNNFKDSCWIILTGQKPTSGMITESVGKNDNKNDGLKHGSVANLSNKARLELAMQESRLQHAKETAQSQMNKPGQITQTPPKGEGKLNMRASTLEREPGSTNINHLQQKQLAQIMLPQKRYGHSSTIIEDKMYIFGGAYRKGNGSNFHSFHECQLKLDNNKDDLFKWRRIQGEAPKLRDSHSCISFHDHLLIFGGGSNNECFNDLYKFSITNKIWTKLESISDNGCPSPREGHVAVLVEGDKMLVHGGINENQVCFNDAYILVGLHQEIDQAQSEIKFDEKGQIQNTEQLKNRSNKFEALRWFKCEQEGDVPSQRDSHSSVLANNQIYIFGGQDNDENLHNDFYRVTIQQSSTKILIGDRWFYDKVFKLKWKKIEVNSNDIPIKRTSHSMNLFNDRWLVLIGGETSIDPLEPGSIGKLKEEEINKSKNSDEIQVGSSEEETYNKALNDVWLYDIHMNTWREIKPAVKVQSCFNSKKMRKSFEPRMAHSAEIYGNYIVIFGGYASQSNQYSPNNFFILSLAGCTDYMLQKPMTIKMIRDTHKKKVSKGENHNLKISIDNSNSLKVPVSTNNSNNGNGAFQPPISMQKTFSTSKLISSKSTRTGEVIKLPGIQSQRSSGCQTIDLQIEEQEIINRCNILVEKHNQSKLKFSMIYQMAQQIKSPLQLIIEIIKSLIDVHEINYQKIEKYEKQKQIVNIHQYGSLDISIHLCQYDEISILFIKDNGPGMTHTDLKVAMTGQCQGEISNKYDIFKYASLHLAVSTFVITKTQTIQNQQSSNLNIKFNNEVHVGLLSSRFIKDSNSDYLIAPIVSFDVVENPNYKADGQGNKYDLVAKTPLSEKFICLILSYIGIFQNINELKQHILQDSFQNDKFQTGTQIYLCELNEVLQSYEHDIFLDATKRSEKADLNIHTQSTIQIEQMIHENENLEHSLNTLIKYSYIDFPAHVNLQVNNLEVEKENPFNKIISYVLENENQAIKGQTNDYRYWIISQQSLVNFGIDDKVINKMEGLLIYKNNEFVKKDDLAQPHTYVPRVGSKRQHLDQPSVNDILHGIIMVETASENCNLTIDRQDLVNENLLQAIRDEIYANYLEMREQNYQQIDEMQQKRTRYDPQQLHQTHAIYPQISYEYGQIAYPMYPSQNDGRITREEYDALPDDKKQEYMDKMNQMTATGVPMQNQNVAVPAVANYQSYNMQHHQQYQNFQQQNPQETNEKIMAQERQKIDPGFQNQPQDRVIPIELNAQQKADYDNEQLMQQQIAGFGPSLQLSYHPTLQSSVPNQK